jgi:hypothetical protein
MQVSHQTHTVNSNSHAVSQIDPILANTTGIAVVLLPAILVSSIFAQRRYRQRVLKVRTARLERSWKLSPHQTTH